MTLEEAIIKHPKALAYADEIGRVAIAVQNGDYRVAAPGGYPSVYPPDFISGDDWLPLTVTKTVDIHGDRSKEPLGKTPDLGYTVLPHNEFTYYASAIASDSESKLANRADGCFRRIGSDTWEITTKGVGALKAVIINGDKT